MSGVNGTCLGYEVVSVWSMGLFTVRVLGYADI